MALEAWERAKERLSELGIDWTGLILHHDQDPVFTSYAWTSRLLLDEGVRLSYALRGARDNPEMEAFVSRFKTENRSLFLEAVDLVDLRALVRDRMDYYNRERRHSALGYLAPLRYVETLEPNVWASQYRNVTPVQLLGCTSVLEEVGAWPSGLLGRVGEVGEGGGVAIRRVASVGGKCHRCMTGDCVGRERFLGVGSGCPLGVWRGGSG